MHIAIVLNAAWNVYNFRLGLIQALRCDGHQVTVIAPEDASTRKLEALGFECLPVPIKSSGVNPVTDLALLFRLYELYQQVRPDVVLHYTVKPNIYGTLAAHMLGIPSINNVCGLGTVFLKKGLVSWVAKALYRLAFRFPQKVFFQNADDHALFVREKLIRKEIADAVPGSGINLSDFQAEVAERSGDRKFTFLVISRLIYDKGILEYMEAIRLLRKQGVDARFQLLGAREPGHKRGIQASLIQEWIEQEMVEYLGTTDDVRPFIRSADCVVLPSYREGLPRTLLEAASLCKPVVTTNVPGCRDVVVDQENGFLCEVRNAKDLADKMLKMSSLRSEELQQMGYNGRKRVEACFDEKIVIQKYQEAIWALRPSFSRA